MATKVLEGTWEEIVLQAAEFSGRRVRLTILDAEPGAGSGSGNGANATSTPETMIRRGMFPQFKALTEDDFRSAEWRGEDLDPL